MIETLHIKNFQVFEDIEIKGLRRVNLIAGKNNAGKTAMLEALRILAARGESTVVNNVLKRRSQFIQSSNSTYEALFNRALFLKNTPFSREKPIICSINSLDITRNFEMSRYYKRDDRQKFDNERETLLDPGENPDFPKDIAVYIPFGSDMTNLRDLWDKIVLTPSEDDVFRIIQETIEPKVIRLDFSKDIVKVRLKDEQFPVPLPSLGDGVQRILLMAIALVSAKNKMLLIDEFETGLHHSVQERLWEMIFEYATKWNIQVFATTHSQDTVRKFYYVADTPEYANEATFLRLQFDRLGVHEAQVYDMERLGQSLESHLETR